MRKVLLLMFVLFLLVPVIYAEEAKTTITREDGNIILDSDTLNIVISPENAICSGSYFDQRMQLCEHEVTITNKDKPIEVDETAFSKVMPEKISKENIKWSMLKEVSTIKTIPVYKDAKEEDGKSLVETPIGTEPKVEPIDYETITENKIDWVAIDKKVSLDNKPYKFKYSYFVPFDSLGKWTFTFNYLLDYIIDPNWITSNTTNWGSGVYNNTLLNQTTGALTLSHGNNSEINATIPPFDADDGLVAYWKLNNNSAIGENYTFVVDSSGNGNNGTIRNGSSVQHNVWNTSGKIQGAMVFDGKDDFVNIINTAPFNMTNFSISVWEACNGPGGYSGPFNNRVAGQYGFQFANENELNPIVPHLVIIDPAGTEVRNFKTTASFTCPFSFKHFVWTYSNTTGINRVNLYINGVNQTVLVSAATTYNLAGVLLGKAYSYFNGTVDEIMVFNRTLNSSEVSLLWNMTKDQYPSTGTYESPVTTKESSAHWANITFGGQYDYENEIDEDNTDWKTGLVALWHMNNDTSNQSRAVDSTVYGNHCNLMTGANWTNSGKIKSSTTLDGLNMKIDCADDNSLDIIYNLTITAWIFQTSYQNGDAEMVIKRDASGTNYQFFTGGTGTPARSKKLAYYDGLNVPVGNSEIPLNQWTFVAVTVNNATNLTTFYVNGIQDGSSNGKIGNYFASKMNIGSGLILGPSPSYGFNGTLDEIAIWNRTLSADEIYELYQKGTKRLKAQVRTCAEQTCTDVSYIGPDNTSDTYFTNNSIFPTSMTNNSYFQYKLFLETDEATRNETVFVYNVTIGWDSSYCDKTITSDLTLATDVLNCPNKGIIIGANNVFLDCAGKTIMGSNQSGSIGISSSSYYNLTIINCIIKDFIQGIYLLNVNGSLINNNTIYSMNETGVTYGLYLDQSAATGNLGNKVYNNYAQTVNTTGSAIAVDSGESEISNCTGLTVGGYGIEVLAGNNISNSIAIGVGASSSNRGFSLSAVNANNLTANSTYGRGFYLMDDTNLTNSTGTSIFDSGILTGSAQINIKIDGCMAYSTSGIGIAIYGSNHMVNNSYAYSSSNHGIFTTTGNIASIIENNTVYTSGISGSSIYGITVGGGNVTLRNNIVNGTWKNTGTAYGIGISGAGNVISGNSVYSNSSGITLTTGQNNTVYNNTAISSDGTGISVTSANNTIDSNIGLTITSNANYGIYVTGSQNIIKNNYANGTHLNRGIGRGFMSSGANNLLINNTGYTNTSTVGFDIRGYNAIAINNTGIARGINACYLYGAFNFTVINIKCFSNSTASGSSLNLQLSADGVINNSNFTGEYGGINSDRSNNTVIVNSIISGRNYDLSNTNSSNMTIINSTFRFNDIIITDILSNITIAEYVRINVTNSSGAMYNANITFNDSFNAFKSSQLTLTNGFTPWVQVTTYFKNYTATTNYINYTILGIAVGHSSKTASINFTQDKQYNLNLSINSAPTIPILLNANSSNFTAEVNNLNWTNSTDDSSPITYVIQIANISDFSSASLYYVNDIVPEGSNVTSINVTFTSAGNYYWRVLATDGTINSSFSPVRQFNVVLDAQGPSVNWNYPENNVPLAPSIDPIDMEFNYSVFDNSTMSSCEFYLAGIMKNRVTTPLNGTSYNVTVSFVPANLEWFVRCNDSYNNVGTSEIRYFVLTNAGGGGGGSGVGEGIGLGTFIANQTSNFLEKLSNLSSISGKTIKENFSKYPEFILLAILLVVLTVNYVVKRKSKIEPKVKVE